MINNVMSGGKYIQVSGGGSTYVSRSYNSNAKMVGDMMYDVDNQCIKVYTGSDWAPLTSGSVTIGLTGDAESLLDWARLKRAEEMERNRLAETNPAIKDLLNQIKQKEDQIDMVMTLIKSPGHDSEETSGP